MPPKPTNQSQRNEVELAVMSIKITNVYADQAGTSNDPKLTVTYTLVGGASATFFSTGGLSIA